MREKRRKGIWNRYLSKFRNWHQNYSHAS